ncbi:MAG: methylamine utilization protein [Betaproteobacteria bacterium]|nr:methylamine utilization protein [Betaproteobacteria bacterium]
MKTILCSMLALASVGIAHAAHAAEILATVRDSKGLPVEDAVILAMPLNRKAFEAAKPHGQVIDQVNKEFIPYVRVVFNGTLVSFPNKDNIRHHVYSFSPAKKFELPLYSGVSAPPVLFDKPGVVVLGCNIHDWMIGYVYVADTPFFGKTEKEGHATLANLPAGDYQVHIWHPDMEKSEQTTMQRVTITDKPVNMAWTITLKPPFRIPRPTGTNNNGYR